MAELAQGTIISGYRIESVAGRGGMGVVYKATQVALDRPVGLKLIAPELAEDDRFRERFKRESMIAASIEHPNVIPLYEAGEEDGRLFIIMRYVEGTDLRAMIARQGRLDPRTASRIAAQVASALDAAHARGLVHRDVKPANVLIAGREGEEHVYLTDFGLTKEVTAEGGPTKTGTWVGTVDYVAPEQVQGQRLDARADVYALGCVLFQMLTGKVPFPKDTDVAKIFAHVSTPPPRVTELAPPGVPAEFDEVVRKAMAKDRDDRYLSTGDLGRAALAAARGQTVTRAERSVASGPAAPPPPVTPAGTARGAPPPPPPTAARAPGGAPATGAAPPPPTAPGRRPPPPPPPGGGPPTAPRPAGAPGARIGAPARSRGPLGLPRPALIGGAAVLGVALLVAVALAALGGGGGGGDENPAGEAVGTIPVGEEPFDVEIAQNGDVWVANTGDGTIRRIDPDSGAADEPIEVEGNPQNLAIDGDTIWVSNYDGAISRVDTESRTVEGDPIDVGNGPNFVAVGQGSVWTADSAANTVTRVDPARNRKVKTIRVGEGPSAVAVEEGSVWVTNSGEASVTRIDPATNRVVGSPIRVGDAPFGVEVDDDVVWVGTGTRSIEIDRIDANSGERVGNAIPLGEGVSGVDVAGSEAWMTLGEEEVVKRMDLDTGNFVGEPIPVGRDAADIAIGDEVWVGNTADGTVTRIRP